MAYLVEITIIMKKTAFLLLTATLTCNTYAAEKNTQTTLDTKQLYFGGGLSLNDIGFGDDAVGYQIFAGLPIPVDVGNAKLMGELGYMNSGDFDINVGPFGTRSESASGLWANAVIDVPLQNNISLIGRIGLDFGDDDGVMIGGGFGFQAANNMEIRVEYVIRDNIDSLQANLVIRQ